MTVPLEKEKELNNKNKKSLKNPTRNMANECSTTSVVDSSLLIFTGLSHPLTYNHSQHYSHKDLRRPTWV